MGKNKKPRKKYDIKLDQKKFSQQEKNLGTAKVIILLASVVAVGLLVISNIK